MLNITTMTDGRACKLIVLAYSNVETEARDLSHAPSADRGNISHTRNQHLGNHRGSSVAFSDGLSVAFSNIISLFSGSFQRIVTCPVDFHWNCLMDFQ